jgi:hypothetical protein
LLHTARRRLKRGDPLKVYALERSLAAARGACRESAREIAKLFDALEDAKLRAALGDELRAELRAANADTVKHHADIAAAHKNAAALGAALGDARADATQLRAELTAAIAENEAIWVPRRPSGKGAGRGCPHTDKLRATFMKLITEGVVSPEKCSEVHHTAASYNCSSSWLSGFVQKIPAKRASSRVEEGLCTHCVSRLYRNRF